MSFPNRNALWAHALIDELVLSGAAHACLSPGSRSTPLSLACLNHPRLKSTVHHDERAAAFFALGLAKVAHRPVLLVCTSGTAAANYLPAVVEASLSQVPLIVLTADRPHEARGWGAPQTIDQVRLYGEYARWAVDLPLPEPTAPMLAFVRQTASRAVQAALGAPRGPVHLNVPLRDPLPPIAVVGDVPAELASPPQRERPRFEAAPPSSLPPESELRRVAQAIAREPRGVISVGPLVADAALARALVALAEASGYPLLAEVTSSLRAEPLRPHLIAHTELLARNARFAASHRPRLALRLGQALTTRALLRYIDSAEDAVLIDEPGRFVDPGHRASSVLSGAPAMVVGRLAELVRELAPARDEGWSADFQTADALASAALARALDAEERLGELHAARELFDSTPAGVPLFVASSMPIRDLESTAGTRHELSPVLANRGANGIDGTVASALGAAAASGGRSALLIGDVALLHDLNSLSMARLLGLQLTVLLVNNDGGGIFSFLEVANAVDAAAFERLWGTPHGTDFAAAVAAFGGEHRLVHTRAALRSALAEALQPRGPGVKVVELRTDRRENVAAHQRVFAAVNAGLEGQPWRCTV